MSHRSASRCFSCTYGPRLVVECFSRILNLQNHEYLFKLSKTNKNVIPPGAVGGLYGSGCFHFSNNASVSWKSTYSSCQDSVPGHSTNMPLVTYSLLTWLSHVFVGFKKRSDVLRLTAPDVTMNGPIEGELKASPIQRSGAVCQPVARGGRKVLNVRNCLLTRHDS